MQGSAKDFLKPKLIDLVEESNNEFQIILEPLERGFGYTLGSSLRRTLLSSMVGSAVTEVAIDGVVHEYSTIDGVQEDVLDILLNLKEAAISLQSSDSDEVTIEKSGPATITVADIEANSNQVVAHNPDMIIATINEGSSISMTLKIETGVGYDSVASREQTSAIGGIQIDASFSPIQRVSFTVDATRAGERVNLDRLNINMTTNGSINAEDARRRPQGGVSTGLSNVFEKT
ncbi:MAG TPA: DNA-directed RNA polymerase subunit alpha [Campylobacterales bacterium]|nr:DNA-directed RNA polymerase subunit alpha [Campylobacterales bacterium]